MRVFLSYAALTVVLLPSTLAAQTSPLTEADALARLSPASPRVAAIRAAIDIARADLAAASRWPNPRLSITRESVAGVAEHMTTVLQPLPLTGRRNLEIKAASALVDASASRADEEMRRARAELRRAFSELRAAQIRERELSRARDRLSELGDMLAKREAAGDAAGFDRLRAEREMLDIEADRSIASTDRARAQATLASFFSGPVDPTILVAGEAAAAAPALPPVEGLIERAEAVRGEILALRHDIDAARFSERAAARRLIPEPEAIGGSKSSTAAGGDIGSVFGVQATLPLFDRARPERALARARMAQLEARLEAFRILLRSQVIALRTAAIERRALADRYRATAFNSADQVERIAQISYEAGERGILELLDAFRTSAGARVRQAALDASAREAEIELEFISGWEIP
jgi:cobalt-zinc-cadmium efflux system outer membrane protein